MKTLLSIFFVAPAMLLLTNRCVEEPKDYVVTFKTEYGDMVAILYDETPKHKANFVKLAQEHYFDGTLFHRVMKDFMIQGGDPDSKTVKPGEHLGNGGPGYTIPAEFNPKFYHEKGALSAARLSDPQNPTQASSGSQFFIVQGTLMHPLEVENLKYDKRNLDAGIRQMMQDPQNKPMFDSLRNLRASADDETFQEKVFSLVPRIEKSTGLKITQDVSPEKVKAYTTVGGAAYLDGQYTVFGKVIKGLEVIDKIAAQPGDAANRPLVDIPVKVTIEEMAKSKITKLYGYPFSEKQ